MTNDSKVFKPRWSNKRHVAPELILPAEWNVAEGKPSIDLTEHVIYAPSGNAPYDRATRIQGYIHVRHASEKLPHAKNKFEQAALACFEQTRINALGVEQGVQRELNPIFTRMMSTSASHPFMRILKGICGKPFILTNHHLHDFYEDGCELTYQEETIVDEYGQKIIENRNDPNVVYALAQELASIYYNDEDEPDGDEFFSEYGETEEKQPPRAVVDPVTGKDVAQALEKSARMHVVDDLPMARRPVTKRPKRTDSGFILKHPERVYTDQLCFDLRKKRPYIGTILIDCSGSMSIERSELTTIVEMSNGATIAGYCEKHRTGANEGNLYILSQNGYVVKKLPSHLNGYNAVDYPALCWLMEQQGPHVWVSDGGVNGRGGDHYDCITNACFNLVRSGGVTRFGDLTDLHGHLLQLIQAINRRR